MGESGGGSLTGPRLHRLQEFQEDFKMTAGGAWRRPRMKVYDYNQEFGGNYYQPMIQYINHKDIYGPFSKKADVYLPHSAEVTSAKYTNILQLPYAGVTTTSPPPSITSTSSLLTLTKLRS